LCVIAVSSHDVATLGFHSESQETLRCFLYIGHPMIRLAKISRLEAAAGQLARKVLRELLSLTFAEVLVADIEHGQVLAVVCEGAHARCVVQLVCVDNRFFQKRALLQATHGLNPGSRRTPRRRSTAPEESRSASRSGRLRMRQCARWKPPARRMSADPVGSSPNMASAQKKKCRVRRTWPRRWRPSALGEKGTRIIFSGWVQKIKGPPGGRFEKTPFSTPADAWVALRPPPDPCGRSFAIPINGGNDATREPGSWVKGTIAISLTSSTRGTSRDEKGCVHFVFAI
jgi:hypothetical protein